MIKSLVLICLIALTARAGHLWPWEVEFAMVHQKDSPQGDVENATIAVLVGVFSCEDDAFPIVPEEEKPRVIAIGGIIQCYSSELSDAAERNGYAGVLIANPSSFYELANINYWSGSGTGVPVYRTNIVAIPWYNITYISLYDDSGPSYFETSGFYIQLALYAILAAPVALFKTYKCIDILSSYKDAKNWKTHGIAILVCELLASPAQFIDAINPYGMAGYSPFPLTSFVARWFLIFTFLTTAIAWDGMKTVQLQAGMIVHVQALKFGRFFLRVANFMVCGLNFALLIDRLGPHSLSNDWANTVIYCFLIFNSYYAYSFIRNKFNIIAILARSNSTKKRENAERAAYYLAMSALFVIFQVITWIIALVFFQRTMPALLVWYVIIINALSGQCIGLYQVLSVPYNTPDGRKTGTGTASGPQSSKAAVSSVQTAQV